MIETHQPVRSIGLSLGWYGPVDGHWLSLLDHFSEVELLERPTASECQDAPAPNRAMLVGLEHRNDERLGWLLETEAKRKVAGLIKSGPIKKASRKRSPSKQTSAKDSSAEKPSIDDWSRRVGMACVLGEDWAGHRRSMPLPESIETFYWHQWYDQVIPWVSKHCEDMKFNPMLELNRRSEILAVGLRVQRIETDADRFSSWIASPMARAVLGNRIAWVLSDQDSRLDLWHGILESHGVRTVGTRVEDNLPMVRSDLILVDLLARDGMEHLRPDLSPMLVEIISRARSNQPEAFMVVIDPFSRMDRWAACRGLGADAIVGQPCSVQGILRSWDCWMPSLEASRKPSRSLDR
jgi:hypothetical protein